MVDTEKTPPAWASLVWRSRTLFGKLWLPAVGPVKSGPGPPYSPTYSILPAFFAASATTASSEASQVQLVLSFEK